MGTVENFKKHVNHQYGWQNGWKEQRCLSCGKPKEVHFPETQHENCATCLDNAKAQFVWEQNNL